MTGVDTAASERLLRTLAEQIKAPLLEIARASELAQITDVKAVLKDIEYTADMALGLIDSYLLSVQLQNLPALQLEPIAVSSVLQDTAHRLSELARQQGCELMISLPDRYGPILGHRPSLEAAYMSLGYSFIQSLPPSNKRHQVVLAAHRTKYGLTTGIFGDNPDLTAAAFRRAKSLYGAATVPLPSLGAQGGAGIFIADALLRSMASSLRVARHHKLSGLAATLLQSQQLQLV